MKPTIEIVNTAWRAYNADARFTSRPTDAFVQAITAALAAAPREPTDIEVDAFLDEWFANPKWRETYQDGPPVRDYARRGLTAAREAASR